MQIFTYFTQLDVRVQFMRQQLVNFTDDPAKHSAVHHFGDRISGIWKEIRPDVHD